MNSQLLYLFLTTYFVTLRVGFSVCQAISFYSEVDSYNNITSFSSVDSLEQAVNLYNSDLPHPDLLDLLHL